MWKKIRPEHNEEGQAMIEFILGLMIVISFFFFYVRMSALFAVGNYIHYATFMAARAYSSSAATQDDQTQNAASVIKTMLSGKYKTLITPKGGDGSSIKGVSIGPGDYYKASPTEDYWNQGVTFEYTCKLSLYPWSRDNQSILLDLTSESWMVREEASDECAQKLKTISGALGTSGAVVEWDNAFSGC